MSWLGDRIKKLIAWIKQKLGIGTPTTTTGAPNVTTTTPAPEGDCHGDTSKPICEPLLQPNESETPKPQGLDVRFWVWSPAENDVVKCGTTAVTFHLYNISGKQITGISKVVNGQQWCYKGYKPTSSSNPLNPACTGTYQNTTYRLIYETRQV